MLALLCVAAPALAQSAGTAGSSTWGPQVLGTQINIIGQQLAPFHSPYSGPNSLASGGDRQLSDIYGIYLGQRVSRRLEGYLDIEMARGSGIGRAIGLASYVNGDVIRQGSADLGQGPYVARAFARYSLPLVRTTVPLSRAPDQLPDVAASRRLELQAGRFAVSDLFDLNRYANSARLQFMNWGLFQNTAWDFAADTRGYTNGVALSFVSDAAILRVGSFQMPRAANGNVYDSDVRRARGDNVELTLSAPRVGTIVRLLGFVNHARMGSYASALAIARASSARPDIVADDRPGRSKSGWGVNIEQPLADSGETGLFARFGHSDGRNESFAFTEADTHASAGIQLAGTRWHRSLDRFSSAAVQGGISALHREYLAAGGRGFLLGDGRLRYGRETVWETFYRAQVGTFTELTPDVQFICNPGYNRDRGPATVFSLRLNLRY